MLETIVKDSTVWPCGQKVLKADDYRLMTEANELINQARRRADEIIAQAEAVFYEQKSRGYADGFTEGSGEVAQQLLSVTDNASRFLGSIEQKVSELLIISLRRMVGEFDDDELARRLARQALNALRSEQTVRLKLHPSHIAGVEDTLRAEFPGIEFLEIVGDERLATNQCLLESELGVVDASVETQLEALRQAFSARFNGSRAISTTANWHPR